MRVCQFNFNNEVNTFEIHVEDDGRVTVPGENGQVLAEYESVEQLAEIYAQARDVKPENLKNWTLQEHGNVFSYILRAGTAGVSISEVEEQLEGVFQALGGRHHALSIARAKEQIMSDVAAELVDALVHCTETAVARDVWDAMSAAIDGGAGDAAPAAAEEEANVDDRSDLERYIDDIEEIPGALGFLATLAGLSADSEKAAVLEALSNSRALSNVSSLRAIYDNAVSEAINEGIGVNNTADALTIITQRAAGTTDEAAKGRMVVAARLAGRDRVNISVDIVGAQHIRHTAELVSLEELDTVDLFVRNNVPYIVRFSDTIDDEIEAERDAAAAEEEREEGLDIGGYEDDYEEDYEDDYEGED